MVNRLVLFCVFCVSGIFLVQPAFSGEASDLAFIRKTNPIARLKTHEVVHFNPQETSELKFVVTGLIRLYQKFISSQDGPTCNFQPTCSHFGMACIQEYGIIKGLLLTSDRLLRCNGSQSQLHHKDSVTGKYIDPVSDYATFK